MKRIPDRYDFSDRDRIQGHVKQLSDDLASSSAALVAMKAKEVELTDKFSLVTSELADSNVKTIEAFSYFDSFSSLLCFQGGIDKI